MIKHRLDSERPPRGGQYVTEHLRSVGAVEIPRRRYRALLDHAIAGEPADFMRLPPATPISGADALEIVATRS